MATQDAGARICPSCGHANAADNNFCVSCGTALHAHPETPASGGAPRAPAAPVDMQTEFAQLSSRISALEARLGLSRPSRTGPAPQPQPVANQPVSAGPTVAKQTPPPASPSPPQNHHARGSSIDWEKILGRNWFAIIGAVALALGAAFFLRLAIDNNWIGETGRVLLGLVGGLIMLGVGEYTAKRVPIWSQAVTGGGIFILYLSIYAAFGFYDLISPAAALAFLALVVAVAGLLSLRNESLVIALMGITGAFLTPLLLGNHFDDQRFVLLGYLLVVDLGILGVSTFRNWRWFTLLGMLGTYGLFSLWINTIPNNDLILAQAGISGAFLIFVGATTLFHIVWRRPPSLTDMILMSVNAIAYYCITFGLLWDQYEVWFGLISLSLALFYGVVGYASIKRSGAPPQVALYSLATGLLFVTIAVPLQLEGEWITIAWAAEGAILTGVGLTVVSRRVRMFAMGVFAVALFRLLVIDTTATESRDFELFANDRFPTFVVAIAAFYVAAFLYRRSRGAIAEWEAHIASLLFISANLLTVWALSAEVINFFERKELEAIGFNPAQDARNAQASTLTAVWAFYGIAVVGVAFARRSAALRLLAIGLIALVVAKLVLFDTFVIELPRTSLTPVVNIYFLAVAATFALVVYAAFLVAHNRSQRFPGERYLFATLVVVANAVALWGLSAESWRFLTGEEHSSATDLDSAKHLSLTVFWTLYAIGLIAAGIARRSRVLRLAGIGLILIPVAKLFIFDIFLLEQGYRVAAFVTLGVLFLALGLAYQQYSEVFRGFFSDTPQDTGQERPEGTPPRA